MIFGEKSYLVEILGKKLGDCTCCCWGNLTEKVCRDEFVGDEGHLGLTMTQLPAAMAGNIGARDS